MAAKLRTAAPEIPLVRGEGNRLPFAAGSFDVVTYAQGWHWTDPTRSVPEALRVLRPHGVLALWWNQADVRVPWVAAEDARLAPFTRNYPATVAELFAPFPVHVVRSRWPPTYKTSRVNAKCDSLHDDLRTVTNRCEIAVECRPACQYGSVATFPLVAPERGSPSVISGHNGLGCRSVTCGNPAVDCWIMNPTSPPELRFDPPLRTVQRSSQTASRSSFQPGVSLVRL